MQHANLAVKISLSRHQLPRLLRDLRRGILRSAVSTIFPTAYGLPMIPLLPAVCGPKTQRPARTESALSVVRIGSRWMA